MGQLGQRGPPGPRRARRAARLYQGEAGSFAINDNGSQERLLIEDGSERSHFHPIESRSLRVALTMAFRSSGPAGEAEADTGLCNAST